MAYIKNRESVGKTLFPEQKQQQQHPVSEYYLETGKK